MPLLDHFHPPLTPFWQWGSFYNAWASGITQQLNRRLLPPDYYARPHVQLTSDYALNMATWKREAASGADGGIAEATTVWLPPQPALEAVVEFVHHDLFEVQVIQDLGGPQLRAAIELVSPANKDRPGNQQAFTTKCGAYLQRGVSVVIVDIVTDRLANLHLELMRFLEEEAQLTWESPSHLYAVAYRVVRTAGQHHLQVWPAALALGVVLPTLPLWLDVDLCLPLRLEESYRATCESLRIRMEGPSGAA
jgi:hypothetical protein